jgi:hypothetical protein
VRSTFQLLLLIMLPIAASCSAQSVRTVRQMGSSDQALHIQVVGSFRHAALTDPKHRVNLITAAGVEKTFPDCSRFDMPEQFGIPDSLDYVGFRVRRVLPGRYKITMRATKTAGISFSVSAGWNGGGAADAGGGPASAGDEVVCYVRVTPDPENGAGAFKIKIEGFRAKAPRLTPTR